jgi:16S rRNA processing protein RimM
VSHAGRRPDPEDEGTPAAEAGERAEPEFLAVGHITKAHGTKGEVFVWPLTDTPHEIFAPGREVILGDTEGDVGDEPLALVVEHTRPFKRGVLVRFEGYPDRTAVDPLAQRYVLLPIEELEPLEEGEVYYHQLLGLEVVTTEGEVVGRVREVFDTEPAHLLEVKGPEKVHLIPFVERIVKKVDLEAGRVVIKPPPGLLEL